MKYFTTLSQSNEVENKSLEAFLMKNCSKYFYVHEQGKNKTHDHIHIFLESNKWSSTDTLTKSIRKLYDPQFVKNLDSTRHLVVTKNVKSVEGAAKYMLKEQESLKNLKIYNFDEKFLKLQFKKLGLTKLVKSRALLSLLQAPYILNERIPAYAHITERYVLNELGDLALEDYIVHHLFDSRSIQKITLGLQALRGNKLSLE